MQAKVDASDVVQEVFQSVAANIIKFRRNRDSDTFRGWLWTIGAIALNGACLLNPSAAVQRYLLLAVWVWPLVVWSQMGVRERRFNTEQMVFSAPRPALRQLPATWLAGVVFTVVAGSGAWLHLALRGEAASLLGWFVGALFVPALALALGRRLRELSEDE